MPTRLVVDSTNQLQELTERGLSQNHAARLIAKVISFVFHPIFVPVYIVLFLLYVHPGVFAGFSSRKKILVLLQAIGMYGFFPLITVLLLKALNFIGSVYLRSQKDRIIPYVACGIWYFWIWYVWRNLPESPEEIVILSMAIFLASSIGLLANIYMKISMHAIAMGVMLAFMMLLALTQSVSFGVYISIALLIAGIVCTARFIASDHTQKEIYAGLLAGFVALLIAIWFN
ncbi:MAG TPA: hypothetical protein VIZ28_11975 [Chitinophagaceae bacterium]